MEVDENKALVRRFVDAQNRGNVDDMLACWAPDSVNHAGRMEEAPRPASVAPGLEGIRFVFESLQAAFPVRRMEITDLIAEGDRVVCRMTVSGTHQGVPAAPVESRGRQRRSLPDATLRAPRQTEVNGRDIRNGTADRQEQVAESKVDVAECSTSDPPCPC